jgi:hypothetical protein
MERAPLRRVGAIAGLLAACIVIVMLVAGALGSSDQKPASLAAVVTPKGDPAAFARVLGTKAEEQVAVQQAAARRAKLAAAHRRAMAERRAAAHRRAVAKRRAAAHRRAAAKRRAAARRTLPSASSVPAPAPAPTPAPAAPVYRPPAPTGGGSSGSGSGSWGGEFGP